MSPKVVVITGASRGIGAAIAKSFAQAGCHLVLTSRNEDLQLEQLQQEILSFSKFDCTIIPCDVGVSLQVESLFQTIRQRYSHIDILINNAGISHIGLLADMTDEQWDQMIATNMNSLFYTCKQVIPLMVSAKEGKIINISSVWGEIGASCEVAYSATKGAMNSFTKALAKELAPSNIQVNAIACGVIDTSMNSCFSTEEMETLIEEIPAGRLGTPQEVAALCLQLCSGNSYLTGQIISLNGGWC